MTNKNQAVMDFINTCPLVGYDLYFNFIDETNPDGNTSLIPVPYGKVIKKYTDGDKLLKQEYEIRQIKPMSTYSNTTENTDQMQRVQEFIEWINRQGKEKNFPDFGEECEIQSLKASDGVVVPSMVGVGDGSALYAFPFEILYLERN